MDYIIGALAVYKIVQVIDVLTPKEAMAWVKILFTLLIGMLVSFVLGIPNTYIGGCAIATLAGTLHSLLRLVVLMGDSIQRKVMR